MDLTPELTELESIALFGGVKEITIPENPLSEAQIYEEIKLKLRGEGSADHLRVPQADLERLCCNLRAILDQAETSAGRDRVATAYFRMQADQHVDADDRFSGAADIYRKARDRYLRPKLRPVEPRIKLVEAACSALREAGEAIEDLKGCIRLFEGTTVLSGVEASRDRRGLDEAGLALSNAWWNITDALESELGLSRWFRFVRSEVSREDVPLEEFLGCGRAFDFTKVRAIHDHITEEKWRQGIPSDVWSDMTFEPCETSGYDAWNLCQHVHDLSFAPTVPLFRQRYWSGHGRLWTPGESGAPKRAFLVIWREVLLALHPDEDHVVAPYLVNRRRVSLHRDSVTRREMDVEYPFARFFGTAGIIPIALGKDRLAVFQPADFNPESDFQIGSSSTGELLLAPSCTSQYANVWGASPGVVPLFLRHTRDETDRPVDPTIVDIASTNECDTIFAHGTIGELVEKATLVPDRAGGVGALLRQDFLNKAAALYRRSGKQFLSSAPFAFEQAWS